MNTSLQLFTFRDIPVKIHWSFILIIGWFGYVVLSEGFHGAEIGWFVVLVFSMFSFVIMHEFGHALTAQRYGVKTKDIVLLPIGGMARLEHIPEQPGQELIIAIAGPLVNVALAIILFVGIYVFGFWGDEGIVENMNQILNLKGVVILLFIMNVGLFLFNLVPAFPMDGGRIFRALLAMRMDRLTATKWASNVGQVLALVFFIYGASIQHFGLVMIGIFIFFTAQMEYSAVKYRQENASRLPRGPIPLRLLYRPQYTPLRPGQSMLWPIDAFIRGIETGFVVEDEDGKIVGTLPPARILEAIRTGRESAEVSEFYIPGIPVYDAVEQAEEVLRKMEDIHADIALVQEDGRPVGIIDKHHLQKGLALIHSLPEDRSESGTKDANPDVI